MRSRRARHMLGVGLRRYRSSSDPPRWERTEDAMKRRALMTSGIVATLGVLGTSTAYADGVALEEDPLADTSGLSPEELAYVERTAAELQEVEEQGGITLDDGTFQPFNFDMLLDQYDKGGNVAVAVAGTSQISALSWDWNHFGNCMSKKLGIADAKAIIKAFAEPKVRKALKSRQWKVASSIAFNILKKTSPKIASFLIKKAAHSVLPGGAVGALVIAVGACALGDL